MKRLLLFILLGGTVLGATYTIAPSGGDYTTFAAFAAAHTLTSDDVVVFQAATVGGSATFDERCVLNGSGTSGHTVVIRKRFGDTVIIRGISGTTRSYINVIGLEFTQPTTAYTYSCITLAGGSNWLIEDNYFHDTNKGAIEMADSPAATSNNNIIRHNHYSNIGGTGGGAGQGGTVNQIRGDHNLAEYNTIDTSLDRFTLIGTANDIRNNYYSGTDTALYPSSSPYPFHTDGIQPYNTGPGTTQLIYERNWDQDNRDTIGGAVNNPNGHGMILQNSTTSSDWAIIRFDTVIRAADSGMLFKVWNNVYNYNLTMVNIGIDRTNLLNSAVQFQASTQDAFAFFNNTWDYMPHMLSSNGIVSNNNQPTNFASGTQHAYNSGTQGVLNAATATANLGYVDPLFTDGTGASGHDNYTLTSGSPLKAAGSKIATASGAGVASTSLTVPVSTIKSFFDGWGIADADYIKIGSGAYVQIAAGGVNTSTGVITLSSARTWLNGDAVIVKGMEDIGALPYAYAATPTVTNTTSTASPTALTATTTTAEAVRKVEFLINGLPIGTVNYDGTGTFSYANTPSGAGTLEARAYNYWASQTPTVSSYLLINQDPSALTATAVSPAQINLAWTDGSSGADGFSIERSANGSTGWTEIATTSAAVVTYQNIGLSAATAYYYRVRAVSGGVYSGYSSNANATTPGSTPFAPSLRKPASLGAGF